MYLELLLMVHLVSVVGWAGLSTGAYLILRLSRLEGEALRAYSRVVVLEAFSGLLILLSGVSMAYLIGFPGWVRLAMVFAAPLVPMEFMHLWVSSRAAKLGSMKPLDDFIKWATPIWCLVFLALMYLMVFKPQVTIFTINPL